MKERRLQLLSMHYGMRSLSYLLEETKLKECGLLGKKESTDDWLSIKFPRWRDVLVPLGYKSRLTMPHELGSPIKTLKRTKSEHEGIFNRMLNMYSPTLLETILNKLIRFPNHPDHNFFVWTNPHFVVHRYDSGLKSWQIKYSDEEHMDEFLDKYGTNELEDISCIDTRVEDLPYIMPLGEPNPEQNLRPSSPS